MPETNVTTAITAAIPITTPSSVSTDRSLLAHSDRSAIRMASAMFMDRLPASGFRLPETRGAFGRVKFNSLGLGIARKSGWGWKLLRQPRAGSREDAAGIAYNDSVGSRTGRSLSAS